MNEEEKIVVENHKNKSLEPEDKKDNLNRVYYDERIIYQYFRYPFIVGILGVLWDLLAKGEKFQEALISGAILYFLALSGVVIVFIYERLQIK